MARTAAQRAADHAKGQRLSSAAYASVGQTPPSSRTSSSSSSGNNRVVELADGRTLTGQAAQNYGKAATSIPTSEPTLVSSSKERTAFRDNSLFVQGIAGLSNGGIVDLGGAGQYRKTATGYEPVNTPKKEEQKPLISKEEKKALGFEDDPEVKAASELADRYQKDLDQVNFQLDESRKYLRDTQLAQIESIKAVYANRVKQQEDVNKRSQAALQQFGISSGANQRSASFIGIMSAEESAGISRIADLEAERESLVTEAQTAIAEKDFEILADRRDRIEKNLEKVDTELKELRRIAREEDRAAEEARVQASRDFAVADLVSQGITDPAEILNYLNYDESGEQIGDMTLKEVTDSLKVLMPDRESIQKFAQDVAKNGAPPSVVQSVLSAKSLNQALFAAGDWSQTATGAAGEYLFYKRQAEAAGQVPMSFDSYQTMDANRKRTVINMNAGGLTSQENQTFLTITNKYQADSVVNAAVKAGQIKAMADQIIADPNNTSNQLASLYLFVKNLDPDSAVREGELALANQTQSYLQQFGNQLTRLGKGQVIAPDAAKELATATKRLVATWQETAQKKTQLYQSQASRSSPNVGNAFSGYVKDSQLFVDTPGEAVDMEAQAEVKVQQVYSQRQAEIDALLSKNPGLTNVEILQILGM